MRYFLNSACLRGFLFLWPFGVVSGRERVPRLGSWKGSPWAPVSFLIYCFAILFAGFFFVGPVPWCPVPWCPVPWCPVLWYPVLQCPGALVLRALCPVPWCPVPCALCLVPCVLCPVPCGVVPWYLVPSDLCPAASSRIDDIMKSMRNKSTKTLLAVFYGTIYIFIYIHAGSSGRILILIMSHFALQWSWRIFSSKPTMFSCTQIGVSSSQWCFMTVRITATLP